ncbi:MAG TPA: glycerol-3-phosphate 1-O-acyltransferase PlsY [Holophagaceae bacterium]|nr:glycerol-3-phosphate 1-O-acyltransferase PlsY [Holophagaceae bacterium]
MFQFDTGPDPMQVLLWCLGAFLLGSIPFGLLLVKLAGKGDVRAHGSGNIGATNVSRVGGKGLGLVTLLLDAAKGFLPVCLAMNQGLPMDLCAALALCAVVGHVFTPWLGFKGGKGVATAVGAALAYRWTAVMPSLIAFVLLLALFRRVSLGSVIGAALLPIAMAWPQEAKHGGSFLGMKLEVVTKTQDPWQAVLFWALLALLVIAKHHANIRRLLNGTEPPLFGAKPDEAAHG